jgi:hypothetical protein
MNLLFDSFWRAAAYCLHPRVILLSIAPLVLMAALALGLGYFFWQPAVDAVNATIGGWSMTMMLVQWLADAGVPGLGAAIAPLVVVLVSTPVIVVLSLLIVAALMTPAIVKLVTVRRFMALEKLHGGSGWGSAFGAMWATLVALVALLLSIPLWFVPPLVMVVPPLIWGWLTYRVMSYDVLAEHASREERRALIARHRTPLFAIGVVTGYLGAAPSLVWASGALTLVLAPVLVPLAVWIYTLVFAFSALWFAHYALAALQQVRSEQAMLAGPAEPVQPVAPVDGAPEPPVLLPLPPPAPPPPPA